MLGELELTATSDTIIRADSVEILGDSRVNVILILNRY